MGYGLHAAAFVSLVASCRRSFDAWSWIFADSRPLYSGLLQISEELSSAGVAVVSMKAELLTTDAKHSANEGEHYRVPCRDEADAISGVKITCCLGLHLYHVRPSERYCAGQETSLNQNCRSPGSRLTALSACSLNFACGRLAP